MMARPCCEQSSSGMNGYGDNYWGSCSNSGSGATAQANLKAALAQALADALVSGTPPTPAPTPLPTPITTSTAPPPVCIGTLFSACSAVCGTGGMQYRIKATLAADEATGELECTKEEVAQPCNTELSCDDVDFCIPQFGDDSATAVFETVVGAGIFEDGAGMGPRDLAFHPVPGSVFSKGTHGDALTSAGGEELWVVDGTGRILVASSSAFDLNNVTSGGGSTREWTPHSLPVQYGTEQLQAATAIAFNSVAGAPAGRTVEQDTSGFFATCQDIETPCQMVGPTLFDPSATGANYVTSDGGVCTPASSASASSAIPPSPSSSSSSCLLRSTDRLNESPSCSGLVHDPEEETAHGAVYWAVDGHNGQLVRYDFQEPAGPGNPSHSLAAVRRYADVILSVGARQGVKSGMALHHESRTLLVASPGDGAVLLVKIDTGKYARDARAEYTTYSSRLASFEYSIYECTEQAVFAVGLSSPSGVAISSGTAPMVFVADYDTSTVHVYDLATRSKLSELHTTGKPGLSGIALSPLTNDLYLADKEIKEVRMVRPINSCGATKVATETNPAFLDSEWAQKLTFGDVNGSQASCTVQTAKTDLTNFVQLSGGGGGGSRHSRDSSSSNDNNNSADTGEIAEYTAKLRGGIIGLSSSKNTENAATTKEGVEEVRAKAGADNDKVEPQPQPQPHQHRHRHRKAIDGEYAYADAQWYQDLKTGNPDVYQLEQTDFDTGSVRITKPGHYVLTEDIYFAPNADEAADGGKGKFWPPLHSSTYPMGQWYLGFFAAVTIECEDVWLDLNGYSIQQRDDFYLHQRWFSVVELGDRPFVRNEGVASLNFQEGDRLLSSMDGTGPGRLGRGFHEFGAKGTGSSASRTIISGGTLGLSSHAGIHGNGNTDVVVEDVFVNNFEVAGIQFNGGDNVAIVASTVGPSHQVDVPSHRLSHATFTNLFAHRYMPGGMHHLAMDGYCKLPIDLTTQKLVGTVQFADRPGVDHDVQTIFDKLWIAQELYVASVLEKQNYIDLLDRAGELDVTLDDAIELFANPTDLPDGSAQYGILFHRIGAAVNSIGAQDEVYMGPEHSNILIRDTNVAGLKHHTVTIPSLAFGDGTFLQGVARDVLPIAEIVNPRGLTSPGFTTYRGNLLADAYIAMHKLSTDFYVGHVLDSGCGNFASNLTSNFAKCPDATIVNPVLSGRDIALIQKKYFGGIALSENFVTWATVPGTPLSTVIEKSLDVTDRRQRRHYITCGHDTMFHVNKGAIGIRLEFVEDVVLDGVVVEDIENTADAGHWLCGEQYRLPETHEHVTAKQISAAGDNGANVHGIAMSKVDGVVLNDVTLDKLTSLEGQAIGLALRGDTNDHRDNAAGSSGQQVTLQGVLVGQITAGAGIVATPLTMNLLSASSGGGSGSSIGGVTIAPGPLTHNQLDPPKVTLRHTVSHKTAPAGYAFMDGPFRDVRPSFTLNVDSILKAFNFTHAEMNAFTLEGLAFFESEYGLPLHLWRRVDEEGTRIHMEENPDCTHMAVRLDTRPIVWEDEDDWSWHQRLALLHAPDIVFFGVARHPKQDFHTESMCVGTVCAGPLKQSPVYNYANAVMIGNAYRAYGVYGGPEGKLVYPEQVLMHGAYIVSNPPLTSLGLAKPGSLDHDLLVKFYATCPIDFPGTKIKVDDHNWKQTQIVNCKLDGGKLLGKGWGVGSYQLEKKDGVFTVSIVDNQIFDDAPISEAVIPASKSGTVSSVGVRNPCGDAGEMEGAPLSVQVRADGITPPTIPFSGKDIYPYTKQYHQRHEAATKVFKAFTSMSTDAAIRAGRRQALLFYQDEMVVGTPIGENVNPNIIAALEENDSIHIENQIDLGGGSTIVPYATNDLINQRAYEMVGSEAAAEALSDGRVKESGWMLVVGRSGIHSRYGYLPFGSVAKFGVYKILGLGKYGDVEFNFKDRTPMVPDLNDHYALDQYLWSADTDVVAEFPELATGLLQGLVSNHILGGPNFDARGKTPSRGAGTRHNTRYTISFGVDKYAADDPARRFGPEPELGVQCQLQDSDQKLGYLAAPTTDGCAAGNILSGSNCVAPSPPSPSAGESPPAQTDSSSSSSTDESCVGGYCAPTESLEDACPDHDPLDYNAHPAQLVIDLETFRADLVASRAETAEAQAQLNALKQCSKTRRGNRHTTGGDRTRSKTVALTTAP